MSDYKNTVNLPKTDFPMKASLSQREPEILQYWEKIGLYRLLRKKAKNKPKFVLHDGPPYANGHIHIGHAVNKILKDIIVKSKTLNGFDAPYVPGWDCHGLPIEHFVEKKFGKPGEKISAKDFRQACREYATEQVSIQREEFKRLGVVGDWEQPYLTMDPHYEANIIRAFAKIIKNGHLQRGFKPVHWCVDCASSLAEAEVEYKNKKSLAIDVRFSVLDEESFLARCSQSFEPQRLGTGPINIPIWTTTPWSTVGNQGVALGPTIEYVLIACETAYGQERLLIAHALLKETLARYGIEDYQIVASCTGKSLEGLKLQHPFYEREVPVVLGDHVTLDAGTGAVSTAPAHGDDDYLVGVHYGLPIDNPVGDNGCFLPNVLIFAGEHVNKANEHIVEILKSQGKLLRVEEIQHSYPHCWRHKTPLIFRATPQWFISMEKEGLRRQTLEVIFTVKWMPETGQTRMATMIENRPDWCVSRQRFWGVPMAVFIDKNTQELHPDTLNLMEKIAELVDEKGVEAWFELESEDLLGEQSSQYRKLNDTLDVWFDSGVTHACVLEKNPELHFPADLYLEGTDQHRGWFQSSLLSSVAMHGQAPYLGVLTHGFTVDANGHKMSKSLGNVIAPEKVINALGADILRLWVSSTDYRNEMSVSDEILRRTADAYRRIRNTARYLLANLYDFDVEMHSVPTQAMLPLDRFIVDKAKNLQDFIIKAYEQYQFHNIYQKIHHFCTMDLGSFYLDIIKDRQYTTHKNSLARRSAQTAMYYLIQSLVRWLAPILSFTAEEIWQHLPGVLKANEASIFLTTWYDKLFTLNDDEAISANAWEKIIEVRTAVNKELEAARNAGTIGGSLDAEVVLYCDPDFFEPLALLQNELRFVFITSAAKALKMSEFDHNASARSSEIAGLKIKVTPSTAVKCERCWHHTDDVGANPAYPTICLRCVENVASEGEVRHFA